MEGIKRYYFGSFIRNSINATVRVIESIDNDTTIPIILYNKSTFSFKSCNPTTLNEGLVFVDIIQKKTIPIISTTNGE